MSIDRTAMAARLAQDLQDGWYVNLGIGMPTMVANHVPEGREVVFHSENGVLGTGPKPGPGELNTWLVNAGIQNVTLRPGGSYFHHADSFAMIRGGHLDLCVLGGYQVAENGDFANWAVSDNDHGPRIGGAMDLAVGAQRLWMLMEHTTREGHPRLLHRCTYPLTGAGRVKRIYTNLAVLDVTPDGLAVREIMAAGMGLAELQAVTGARLAG